MDAPYPKSGQERILILSLQREDAELAAGALSGEGLCSQAWADLDGLLAELAAQPSGALLVSEEGLDPEQMRRLARALGAQPAWSDIPVILLIREGAAAGIASRLLELFGGYGNVTPLERPIRALTLVAALEAALRARRRQYEVRDLLQQREQVLASLQDAFATLDRDWRYTYVNERTCHLCNLPQNEMLGRTIWELFPGVLGTELETNLRRAVAENCRIDFEWQNAAWKRWFAIRIYPSDEGVSLFTVEITEQKKTEEVLRESERRLHLALDSSNLGMWYCDLPFDKLTWDLNCRRQFGVSPNLELTLPIFFTLLHPDDQAPTREAIKHSVSERTAYDVEYRIVRPDGQIRWIHAIGRAFYGLDGEPRRFDGVTIDITDRKETELELQRARHEAIEANHAKDHFLAALSHELRTPLTPVLMTVASMRQDPALPAEFQSDLGLIYRNVELEARLIDDLLDLTRITRGKLVLHQELADLHEMIEHTLQMCCGPDVLSKPVAVSWDANAQDYHAYCDPARIQQILWNLINNAIKFTPAHGTIALRTFNPAPGCIEITVADTGIGIAPEILPRLFEAFEQGNTGITRRFGGLGLGLAISKAVADLHGGALRAESEGKDRGATFILELAAVPEPDTAGLMALPALSQNRRALRILLVEDHEATRQVLARLLLRAGHEVRPAGTVAEGLTLAGQHSFDLLVSDLGLPDGSGLELMREVGAKYGLRGIALSGYGMDDDLKASTAAGFAVHLTKPVDWNRLEAALHNLAAPPPERGP